MKFKQFCEATKEDFITLANLQRDKPEKAMRKVQFVMGGGVMNFAVEHTGDLINRMTGQHSFSLYGGYEFVKEKSEKLLRILTNPYGFEREFMENIKTNAPYMKTTEEELKEKVFQAMEKYAIEHEQLPTYNTAQKLAQKAAVSLGRRKFKETILALKMLQSHLGSKEQWVEFAQKGLE